MRRSFEVAVRVIARTPRRGLLLVLPVVAALVWLTRNLGRFEGFFEVALLGAALGLHAGLVALRPAWSWGSARRGGLVLLCVALPATLALALYVGASFHHTRIEIPPGAWLGILHLALLGLLLARAPFDPATAVLIFVLVVVAVPALLPTARPILDPRNAFALHHFPRWDEALAPILALTVIASALPPPPRFLDRSAPDA